MTGRFVADAAPLFRCDTSVAAKHAPGRTFFSLAFCKKAWDRFEILPPTVHARWLSIEKRHASDRRRRAHWKFLCAGTFAPPALSIPGIPNGRIA
ncbi:hypothetical protein [Burkholderia multivorans]|uniref:hypothetical protein n=1 Tax=Burkholderia multivorans TaxID=87883 RepID=UPI001FC80003|nr:hypothetical protein [Burkholderia multivorans]MCA8334776.1 hypothetical protein [Burkholderia multivorans]UXZ63733.1 hypothetical protein NUJ28_26285 [Burkholderia multivorans]